MFFQADCYSTAAAPRLVYRFDMRYRMGEPVQWRGKPRRYRVDGPVPGADCRSGSVGLAKTARAVRP
jgi:hypothetical protein